jgi:hypothetical protein
MKLRSKCYLIRNIVKNEISFTGSEWENISEEAISFVLGKIA